MMKSQSFIFFLLSNIIKRFCFDEFQKNFSATIGVDMHVKTIKVKRQWVALQLWDTAGQERYIFCFYSFQWIVLKDLYTHSLSFHIKKIHYLTVSVLLDNYWAQNL